MSDPLRVVVLDGDPDSVELLKTALEIDGVSVTAGDLHAFQLGEQDLPAFIERSRPDVILYDLGRPYERSWGYLQSARRHPAVARAPLVITTTNEELVRRLFGAQAIGKPYDLNALVATLKAAAVVGSSRPGH